MSGYIFSDLVLVIVVFADYPENKVAASVTGAIDATLLLSWRYYPCSVLPTHYRLAVYILFFGSHARPFVFF